VRQRLTGGSWLTVPKRIQLSVKTRRPWTDVATRPVPELRRTNERETNRLGPRHIPERAPELHLTLTAARLGLPADRDARGCSKGEGV
jgi:hypothetical protein